MQHNEARAMFAAHNVAMAKLSAEPQRQAMHEIEQRLWDGTLADGLENHPWPMDERGEPEQ